MSGSSIPITNTANCLLKRLVSKTTGGSGSSPLRPTHHHHHHHAFGGVGQQQQQRGLISLRGVCHQTASTFYSNTCRRRLTSPSLYFSNSHPIHRNFTATSANMAPSIYDDTTPSEVKNAKGMHLITMNTPNGQAVQILLEELKDAYGTEWTTTMINIMTNVQKEDWFLKLDPNGRIPVLVDNTANPPFAIHETSAEMLYLLKFADKNDTFGFKDEMERSQCLQWLFFWHGSGAPYQGQTNHFTKMAPEKIDYAINRFRNETLRVYGVLEIQLSGKYTGEPREYLAGSGKGKYSVADIKTWPWVKGYSFSGITDEEMKPFPHLTKWIERIAARDAVKRGIDGEKYKMPSKEEKSVAV